MSYAAHPHQTSPGALALKLTRVVLGFNLRELSERTEIDPAVLSKFESGARAISQSTAERLGKALFATAAGAAR